MTEWRSVLNFWTGGYMAGFTPDIQHDFKRKGGETVSRFVLAEQGPAFNVSGLLWRPIEQEGNT